MPKPKKTETKKTLERPGVLLVTEDNPLAVGLLAAALGGILASPRPVSSVFEEFAGRRRVNNRSLIQDIAMVIQSGLELDPLRRWTEPGIGEAEE